MELHLTLPDEQLQQRFFALEKPHHIADLLEVSYAFLEYWLFIAPAKDKYQVFTLPKSSGGLRIISVPTSNLKIIQQKLNQVLQAIYPVKKPVHGFVKGKNIVTNAQVHVNQSYVFNVDLQDFFPSINFGRVRGLFISKPYNLPDKVATVLAQICCHENVLPQGAPTSPIIANMICGQLDDQLLYLAKKHGCRYTRYADDITFSSSRIIFPPAIASSEYEVQTNAIAWHIGAELEEFIERNGFKINTEKVRMQIINQHQEVTGLTINQFPNIKRHYVRQIRAMLYAWEKHGLANAHREYYKKYDQKLRGPYKSLPSFKQIVKGKIDFLGMVRGHDNSTFQKFLKQYETLVLISKKRKRVNLAPMDIPMPREFSFSQWIETLPFPLASILRIYDADDDEKEKYARLLKFFEALAAFWATILLSGYYGRKGDFSGDDGKKQLTFKGLSAPTFGTWVHIVQTCTKHFRYEIGIETFYNLFKTEDNHIFDLLTSTQLIQVLNEAKTLRNKFAHGAHLSQKEATQKHKELRVHLRTMIEIFGHRWFQYKLIIPRENTFESDLFNHRIEYVIGSNTTFKKSRQTFAHALENGKLYFAAPDSQFALQLLPLVRLGPSPISQRKACFFYNGQEGSDTKWVVHHLEDEKSEEIRSVPEVVRLLESLSGSK